MKSIPEIEKILFSKLSQNLENIDPNLSLDYYNDTLIDTSYILAALLGELLKEELNNWESLKWLDDCLMTKVDFNDHEILIWGVMIWGREDTTEQWTDPFHFKLLFNNDFTGFVSYHFLFGDTRSSEITYEEFNQNRGVWDKQYYSGDEWNPSERDWKFAIGSK